MTSRREAILEAIVREYVSTAEPVGSLTLVKKYSFPYSSATIRAEMALLEENGYIMHPHTSAGRVPTEKGYRYFVDMVQKESNSAKASLDKDGISQREEDILERRIAAMHSHFERRFDMAAMALADMTRNVAISSMGQEIYSHGLANLFRQPEFYDNDRVLRVADMIDNLQGLLRELPRTKDFMVLIGNESPVGKSAGCSLIVSRVQLPQSTRGYLGVLGPTRMPYEKVIPLVLRTRDLLEQELLT
ncbi:transcriptional regulator [candidate division WS5 bacterium]|uniref:Transcriptional regulator n=1 Tax=candidate division WS5 bacterium TaxID=2093353 RepID=A0A419DFQ5_9BACT|nr:MAG: transcriptional regulator [candidate division WS5 bacterium]